MEKLPEYHAEEDIEEWLEIFECRAACSKISNEWGVHALYRNFLFYFFFKFIIGCTGGARYMLVGFIRFQINASYKSNKY